VRRISAFAVALVAGMTSMMALAQHQHGQGHGQGHGASHGPDTREVVRFPPKLVEETLANMRDHLQALQQIQEQLGMGHADVAAKIAESQLGMSSLGLHGAAEVSKYMPKGMQDAGSAMHRAASRFAIVAQDADVTGDMKPVFAALADVTAQCVGCHAGYRFR
jgi:hypothetical protein